MRELLPHRRAEAIDWQLARGPAQLPPPELFALLFLGIAILMMLLAAW